MGLPGMPLILKHDENSYNSHSAFSYFLLEHTKEIWLPLVATSTVYKNHFLSNSLFFFNCYDTSVTEKVQVFFFFKLQTQNVIWCGKNVIVTNCKKNNKKKKKKNVV